MYKNDAWSLDEKDWSELSFNAYVKEAKCNKYGWNGIFSIFICLTTQFIELERNMKEIIDK